MTKQDIINEVAKALNKPTKKAKPIVETILEGLKTSIDNGINVEISGFGKFVVRQKPARVGRNPMTGKEAEITERKVVTFKPSIIFRNAVYNSREEL